MRSLFCLVLCSTAMAFGAYAQRGGGHGGGGGSHGSVGGGHSFSSGGGLGGGFHGSPSFSSGYRGGAAYGGAYRGTVGGAYRGGYGNGYGRGYGYRGYGGYYGWGYPYWGFGLGVWPYYGYYGAYSYPYYDSGYYDPYAYPSYYPNAYYGDPPADPPAYAQSQPAYRGTGEYDQYGQRISRPGAAPADSAPIYLFAFKDHTIEAASGYSVTGGTLHYTTLERVEKQAPLNELDRSLTLRLNKEHSLFSLPGE